MTTMRRFLGDAHVVLETAAVEVGGAFVARLEVTGVVATELRFADAPRLPAQIALGERHFLSSADGAALRIELIACAPGEFDVGPFRLRVVDGAGESSELSTDVAHVTVTAPWSATAVPAYPDWWRALHDAREPTGAGPFVVAALVGTALLMTLLWVRRRRAPRGESAPNRRRGVLDLALLATPLPGDLAARRRWFEQAERLVRAELARHAAAADWPWSREELVARDGYGTWSETEARDWRQALTELERGRFAADAGAGIGERLGERLLVLLGAVRSCAESCS